MTSLEDDKAGLRERGLPLPLTLLEGGILLACFLTSDNHASSLVSITSFLLWAFFAVASRPILVFKYLQLIFSAVACTLGCLMCEFGHFYLNELSCESGYVGALPLLVLAQWIMFCSILAFDTKCGVEIDLPVLVEERGRRQAVLKEIVFALSIAFFVLSLVLLFRVASSPAILMGVDRFSYASSYLTGIFGRIPGWLSFLSVCPVILTRSGKYRCFGVVFLAVYFLTLFLTGTKFGGYFNIVCLLFLVHLDKLFLMGRRKLQKVVFLALGSVLILVAFAAFAYSFTSTVSAMDFLTQRSAQQGQLWWKTYDLLDGAVYPEQLQTELSGAISGSTVVSGNVGSDYGIYNIMYFTAPTSRVDAVISSGVRYSEAGFATALYCLGPIGVVAFSFLKGVVMALLVNTGIRCFLHWQGIRAVLWNWLYLTLMAVFAMATLNSLLTTTAFAVISLFSISWLMSKNSCKRTEALARGVVLRRVG